MLVNNYISKTLNIQYESVLSVLRLSESGASIPFMARYRKEATGNLDEVQIESILKLSIYYSEIESRKKTILNAIDNQGLLTSKLESEIKETFDANILEDLYLPFKRKKQTKAEKAKKNGLLGLAKMLMTQKHDNLNVLCRDFIKGDIVNTEMALDAAESIIIEWVVENNVVRSKLRKSFREFGIISTTRIKESIDVKGRYRDFYDFSQAISNCPSYRLLAILRGESEKVLKVKLQPNLEYNLSYLERVYIKTKNASSEVVKKALKKAYKKSLVPSLEAETKTYYKSIADEKSIINFTKNLEQILLSPPVGAKRVLAIDPGFRTGCKVVCLSESGNLLHNTTIFPHPPQNERSKAISKLSQLVEMYNIEAIAIGDGTAGRETENLVKHIGFKRPPLAFVVREDGASIYSASKVAREEFPDYDVTVRGAVSIGRRLSDPLAELVKIDPKSLGVGQYQHDVNQLKLKESLDFTVQKVVNLVGVNLNTASKYLLSYVSGIGPKLAESIVNYRTEFGSFRDRKSLKKVPKLGAKAYEQAAGFLRVRESENFLDNSSVHPESYKDVEKIADQFKIPIKELIGNTEVLEHVKSDKFLKDRIGQYTLNDIILELKKPGIDPRLKTSVFKFSEGIESIKDLKVGMMVRGVISNVTDFGAFVNVGIKTNGLIHKTEIAKEFIEHPTDYLTINQQVNARIILIDIERNRIGLSLK
ncbi:MAG: Tex-like N-terminal domain-containing protein [Crocinitomicaceae bacterium]